MTLVRLHNEDWGYETNCFVCEPTNPAGLQIPFFHDDKRQEVQADFSLPDDFSGAPSLIHGGVTLAVLDEAMAWACIAIGHRWAMTSDTRTRFLRPLHVDSPYRAVARVVDQTDITISTEAQVLFAKPDGRHTVCVEAGATFTILGEAQVQRITGGADVDASYVREDLPER